MVKQDLSEGRIDVHHHATLGPSPLWPLPEHRMADWIWWSPDTALKVMDENNIRVAMLNHANTPPSEEAFQLMMKIREDPELAQNPENREMARRGSRMSNERGYELSQTHPDRFGHFATVMLTNPDDAVAEAVYALDELGSDGIFMGTNVGQIYVGDPPFDPLLAELNRRKATLFIHPLNLPCPLVTGVATHVSDFLLSTVRTANNLVISGAMQRYPDLNIILCHGGGFLPFAMQRMCLVHEQEDPSRTMAEYEADYRRFYLDTALATAHPQMRNILDFADPTHFVYGSDFPFCQPDEVGMLAGQLDSYEMDPQLRAAINHTNAETLFPRLRLDQAASV